MLIAQLTDTHVQNPPSEANARFETAVAMLNAEDPRPAVVLATGDMTNDAKPGELAELVRMLEPLELPLLVLPGNHDDPEAFRETFDMPWASDDHLSWIIDLDEIQIIGLDVTVPGHDHGLFDETRESWFAEALAMTAGRPTLVAIHQPPFASGIERMDASRLQRPQPFIEAVQGADHVSRVVCGHLHRPATAAIGSVTVSTCLSTVLHPALRLNSALPFELVADPAGYQLHLFDGETWVTHNRYLEPTGSS